MLPKTKKGEKKTQAKQANQMKENILTAATIDGLLAARRNLSPSWSFNA